MNVQPSTPCRHRNAVPTPDAVTAKADGMLEPLPVRAYSIDEAAWAAGVSRGVIYKEIARGHLSLRKIGRRSVILSGDFHNWLNALPEA